MALVGEVVARFKAETGDYLAKVDQVNQKNREMATQLLAAAGSADQAIGTLRAAKEKGALGDLGIDARQMGGVISAIKQVQRESDAAGAEVDRLDAAILDAGAAAENAAPAMHELDQGMGSAGEQAKGMHHIMHGLHAFMAGDFLNGVRFISRGLGDLEGGFAGLGAGVKVALGVTAMTMLGSEVEHVTEKLKELHEKFVDGKASEGEVVLGLAEALPILGNWVHAGHNIYEIFEDWGGALKRRKEDLKAIEESLKRAKEAAPETTKAAADSNQKAIDLAQQTANEHAKAMGKVGTAAAGDQALRSEQEKRQADEQINSQFEAQLKPLEEAYKKLDPNRKEDYYKFIDVKNQIDDIEAQREAAKQRIHDQINDRDRSQWKDKYGDMTPGQVDAQHQAEEEAKAAAEQQKAAEELGKKIHDGVTGWFKGSPVTQWIEGQLKEAEKQQEKYQKEAERIREQMKSPAQKFKDQLDEVMANTALTGDEKSKYLRKEAGGLIKERKSIMDSEHDVYSLPKVDEIRAGQVLYAPPTRINEQQLERLEEIRDELKAIKDKTGDSGITVEEIT